MTNLTVFEDKVLEAQGVVNAATKGYSKRKFIVVAGQSNTDYGRQFLQPAVLNEIPVKFRNFERRLKALVRNADQHVYTLMPAQWNLLDQSITGGHGYGYLLGRQILETLPPDEELIIVQVAVGGTGWSNNRWGPMNDLWLILVEQLRYATQTLGAECVGMFWSQGETDAAASYAPVYKHLLNNMVMTVRKVVGDASGDYSSADRIPFVTFDMVPAWVAANGANAALVQAALTNIGTSIPYAANVDTSGLLGDLEADLIHYDSRQLIQMAKWMFNAWQNAKASTFVLSTVASGEYLLHRQTAPTGPLAVGSGGNRYDHLEQNSSAPDPLGVSLYSILGTAWKFGTSRRTFKYRYETIAGGVPNGVSGNCVIEQAYTPFSFIGRDMPAALISTTREYGSFSDQGFGGVAACADTVHTSMSLLTLSTNSQYWAPVGQVSTFGTPPVIPVYIADGSALSGAASETRLYAIVD